MTPTAWADDPFRGTADDGSPGDMHLHLEGESPLPPPAQSIPFDHHDRHIVDRYPESDDERSDDTSSIYTIDTRTVFSLNNDSVVTGPTGSAPSYKGHESDDGKETITVSSFNSRLTVDLKATSDAPRPPSSSLFIPGISPGDDAPSLAITPRMNSATNWVSGSEHAPSFLDGASVAVSPSVKEGIARFEAELDSENMQSTSDSDSGTDSVPSNPAIVPAISAMVNKRGSLGYTMIYKKANSDMLSSHQLKEILEPKNMRYICNLPLLGDLGVLDSLNAPVETQSDTSNLRKDEVINYLFEMITPVLHEAAPKIKCSVRGSSVIDAAALRFGLDKTIVLHHLESGEPIKFVCCDETFPSLDWATETVKAFLEGASPWAEAGLKFEPVDRNEPAHFRIAFSLFHADLDCSVLAQAFFPAAPQPEDRTLWVYLTAFHPQYRSHLAGYMGHEAGHIGGSRHSFDEFIPQHDGTLRELESVTMGPHNPKSVMNYHDDPANYIVQPSDICDMRDMNSYTQQEYKGYEVRRVVPKNEVYELMPSFEFVMKFLRRKARES
ncbi:hypothetical protein F5B22DRAFT_622265 [Xylaria bambusicola]|uniref:uncharacterized protein n=1 Tax=Xylaria bambusicola TaxID=326684 RepID=UPI002007A80B|nr:uncharacterized protein F5B22DRAFT_622265 [Xylaria bambusicola]KAI0506847.1 hypothetical protein F5B22DRAFT_622265 [Xylaria bambusicola]